jgi:uncharacterized protein YbjT (DUF2867 family)
MNVLVLGGTGNVGGEVVRRLLADGQTVNVLTRSEEKAGGLSEDVSAVIGDLEDPTTLGGAFDGADGVFLLNQVSPSEQQQGLVALNECRRAGVRHVVYLSVQHVDDGPHVPHFASKIGIERALAATGVPHTILQPSNFYQNDVFFLDAMVRHGVYPQPLGGVGVSRVDVRDIAEAAINAFRRGPANAAFELVGPEPLTGDRCAEEWSRALGRTIRYAGDDVEAWGRQALQAMPSWMVYDFSMMYELFQTRGLRATEKEYEETLAMLGHEPRSYADFVRELASTAVQQPASA